MHQEEETSFCGGQSCGFYEGIFCGICDVAVTSGAMHHLHQEESPVFRVGANEMPSGGRMQFETSDGSSLIVTAHVGADRVLVKRGETKLGVTVKESGAIECSSGSTPEMLLHVINPAGTAQWVQQPQDAVLLPLPSIHHCASALVLDGLCAR